VCAERESVCENPAIIFPIKKRIKRELFIDRMAALYIGETDEVISKLVLVDWRSEYTLLRNTILSKKAWE